MKEIVNIDGYDIEYKIIGNGEKTISILQGWGTDMKLYDAMADVLSDLGYKVVQLNLCGFGASTEPREAWGVSEFCEIFVKFMNVLGIKKTSLLGHFDFMNKLEHFGVSKKRRKLTIIK